MWVPARGGPAGGVVCNGALDVPANRVPAPPIHTPPPLQAMPYELRALEAALLVLVKILQHEVAALESTTLPGAPRALWLCGK